MNIQEYETILADLNDARDALVRFLIQKQTLKSELYLQIKSHPSKFGIDKVTENGIEAVINTQEKFKILEETIADARRAQNDCWSKCDIAKLELQLQEEHRENE